MQFYQKCNPMVACHIARVAGSDAGDQRALRGGWDQWLMPRRPGSRKVQSKRGLRSHGALKARVKPAQMSCELGQRCIRRYMGSRNGKCMRRLRAPVFHVEECARESGFASQAHFSISHRGRVAKRISECPDRPSQGPLQAELAFSNFAAGFFFAAQRQNGMGQGVSTDANSSVRQLLQFSDVENAPLLVTRKSLRWCAVITHSVHPVRSCSCVQPRGLSDCPPPKSVETCGGLGSCAFFGGKLKVCSQRIAAHQEVEFLVPERAGMTAARSGSHQEKAWDGLTLQHRKRVSQGVHQAVIAGHQNSARRKRLALLNPGSKVIATGGNEGRDQARRARCLVLAWPRVC